jgi:hypothetical protein
MRRLVLRFVLLAPFLACGSLHAAETLAAAAGGPTVTRLVGLFTDLESKLDVALATGDKDTIGRFVAEDFEMRAGNQPGEPIPRAQWLTAMRSEAKPGARVDQMAVHDYGGTAVVSFVLSQGKGRGLVNVFVVDVWVSRQGNWMLTTRYADIPNAKRYPPGVPVIMPKFEKRY